MAGGIAWLKGLGSAVKAALPLARRLIAERKAGVDPYSVPEDLAEPLLDGALARLGTIGSDDPIWKDIAFAAGGMLTRPEQFTKPSVREWLTLPRVNHALRRIAKQRIAGWPEKPEDLTILIAAYMDLAGEDERHAQGVIGTALAVLVASVQSAAVDRGTAAIVQAGFSGTHTRLTRIEEGLENFASHPGLFGDGILADHHGDDAAQLLQNILRRRASPEQNTLTELQQLANDLGGGGKFRAAPASSRAEVCNWIARIAGGQGLLQVAEEAIAEVSALGGSPSQIALAWADVARGNVDAALLRLRDYADPDSRSSVFAILRTKKGAKEAIAYIDSIDALSAECFTPVGWRNIAASLAEEKRLADATRLLSSLPDDYITSCPVLGYVRGVFYSAQLVPDSHKERVIDQQFLAVNDHMLEGSEADEWRQKACEAFSATKEAASDAGDDLIESYCERCLRWLRLTNPVTKGEELAALAAEMNDGQKAVELLPFAVASSATFDTDPLERHLARAEMLGGLSPKELNAKLLLLRRDKRFGELASFIESNWERLAACDSTAALGGVLIESYVNAGECGRAEEVLAEREGELYPLDVPRYRLMIDHCRGEDPNRRAQENYEASGAIEDLWNLVKGLEAGNRWGELLPYAFVLFEREPNAETALRYVECLNRTSAPEEDVIAFLDRRPDLVDRNPDLKSIRAWALFHLGDVDEARRLNGQLLATRWKFNDLGLDINLAMRMGDWERFPDILAMAWDRRADLPPHVLLHLAKLSGWRATERALKLAQEAVDRAPEDPHILLSAYSVASALARDDIAMPWMHRAAQLSKEGEGPVISYSFREVVEMMKDRADDWRHKNDLFRTGNIPMHWAAPMFNIPLSRLLIAIPRENKRQADARRRYPIPTRSGGRRPIEVSAVHKLGLDVTSLIILSELDILERVLRVLDEVYLSPRAMDVLRYEQENVAFHQPSRIQAAKPLLEIRRCGGFALVQDKGPPGLAAEVGEEIAALLMAAKQTNGYCVHSGKLYRSGSYMDEEADLGEYEPFLTSPAAVANALYEEARITVSRRDHGLSYLNRVGGAEWAAGQLPPTAPVYLDKVSAQYLAEAELLTELTNSGRKVFVHPSAVEEWEALIGTEPYTTAMVEALEKTRQTLRTGMAERKVKFFREGRLDEDDDRLGPIEMPIIDLLEDGGRVDAVCVDDRYLNSQPFLEDRKGRKVPMLCCLDLIDMLVQRGEMTHSERREAIHLMREWLFFTLPIEKDEVLRLLIDAPEGADAEFRESAELRVMREYIARLHSADVLCAAADLDYLDELWQVGLAIIKELWRNETLSIKRTEAKANWVVDHLIPDIELALRFAPDRAERIEPIANARLVATLLPADIPTDRGQAYAEWLDEKVVAYYLPANKELVDEVSRNIGSWIIERAKEVADEIGSARSEDSDQEAAGNDAGSTSE